MSSINTAKQSPRLENGKISWYEGDTFAIKLNIALTTVETGEAINLSSNDEIKVTFYRNEMCIHKFVFKQFSENSVMLNFSDSITKKFHKGKYTYVISYQSTGRTTIVANNEVEVE